MLTLARVSPSVQLAGRGGQSVAGRDVPRGLGALGSRVLLLGALGHARVGSYSTFLQYLGAKQCDNAGLLLELLLPEFDGLPPRVQDSVLSYIRSSWGTLKQNADLLEYLKIFPFLPVSDTPNAGVPRLPPLAVFPPTPPYTVALAGWPAFPVAEFATSGWREVLSDLLPAQNELLLVCCRLIAAEWEGTQSQNLHNAKSREKTPEI